MKITEKEDIITNNKNKNQILIETPEKSTNENDNTIENETIKTPQ